MILIFNENQNNIINEAIDFYKNSSEQVFQFDGEAGTGKSVVINEIVRRLNLKPSEILPMAYTGQAAIVMRMKGLINARTCHSTLYEPQPVEMLDAFGRVMKDSTFNMPIMVWKFVPRSFDGLGIKLMIIDEGWMVPLSLKHDIEKHGIKIIVCGDSGQLPPVADSPAYLVSGKIHHLTQLMRQAEDSPLIYIAHRARKGLPIHNGYYGRTVAVINENELTDEMIAASKAIICGKNKTRDLMNKRVREDILGIHRDIPVIGDRVICRKNSWGTEIDGISLANGLCGTVTNMPDVASFDGNTFKIDFQPDLLNRSFHDVVCDYKYFTAPPELRQEIKNDKYSIGEKFEYAYAQTTHITQGAEYPYGIYIEEYLSRDIQSNLNYTGITRFKEAMIYVKKSRRFF